MPNQVPLHDAAIVVLVPQNAPCSADGIMACLDSVLTQDGADVEFMSVFDPRMPIDWASVWKKFPAFPYRSIEGDNNAFLCNHALREVRSEWLLLVDLGFGAVRLRRSTAAAMIMAGRRHKAAGFVCGDYERRNPSGPSSVVHLPRWHEGRVRESTDLGPIGLYRVEALNEVGGWAERYRAADAYDLRLKLSERYEIVQIADRSGGTLCTVESGARPHDVFDYLLDERSAQVEYEQACTEHLKRVDAYVAPGSFIEPVQIGPESPGNLLASVIIPVNHRPEFIGSAIESVREQTEQRVEIIVVVNGGPEDPTIHEVRRFLPNGNRFDAMRPAVRLYAVDLNNIGFCLNLGLRHAKGSYYVQLDSDDRLKPHAVERIVSLFDSDATIGMVIGSYEVWELDDISGQRRRRLDIPVVCHEEWTEENGRNNLLRINGAGAPRSAPIELIKSLGGFSMNDIPHSRNYGEDYELVLRISEHHRIARIWEPIYEVTRHAGGTDHAIDATTIARNDDAKDAMRREAILRRQVMNRRSRIAT